MLIEVWAEWAEWIEGSYMSQKSQVQVLIENLFRGGAIPTDSHVVATTTLGTIGRTNCVCSNFARPREVQNHVEWLPKLN